jgi:conjugative transfer signal peptidase TraF
VAAAEEGFLMRAPLVTLVVAVCAAAVVVKTIELKPVPVLIWNASASIPIGLYEVRPAGKLNVTELVAAYPPEKLGAYMAKRRYLPRGVPLLKRVLALPGQTVCRTGRTITVDGIAMGLALERDYRGRPLPIWQGCQVIAKGDVFLMNWQAPASFDGRYFGSISAASIVGHAEPIWTEEGD